MKWNKRVHTQTSFRLHHTHSWMLCVMLNTVMHFKYLHFFTSRGTTVRRPASSLKHLLSGVYGGFLPETRLIFHIGWRFVSDNVCVLCLTRIPDCHLLPQTIPTDRTSLLQTTPDPPRSQLFKQSLILLYVFLLFSVNRMKRLDVKLTCVFFPPFQTNETKDVVRLFKICF